MASSLVIISWLAMSPTKRRILVTIALPYANGPLHFGHLLEAIQADVWVRFMREMGHECHYIAGSDAHGTPIMLQAEKRGQAPETMVQEVHEAHKRDFAAFQIDFSHFYTTHSTENESLSQSIYRRLKDKGDIAVRTISQAFDPEKSMFLPDRYVKGDCPRCQAPDQYGDSCEVCGATYHASELGNPRSVITGATPIEKPSEHHFFTLSHYQDTLTEWMDTAELQDAVKNKLAEWFEDGLRDWDISRDGPYFGFAIPETENKYFYVWLDAPIGYIASHVKWCRDENRESDIADFWESTNTELYHFIGKDIVYFHALFWPAMLKGANYRLPNGVFAHGFLTINGEKMSKSRGTFITAEAYHRHLPTDALRYYFASKLNDGIDDMDLDLADFRQKVNADLVGKVVNIASRCAGFISKRFDGKLAETDVSHPVYRDMVEAAPAIAQAFESRQFAKAIREIMHLADKANQWIDQEKPWVKIKDPTTADSVHGIATQGLAFFRLLMTYLRSVTPELAQKSEAFLNVEPLTWDAFEHPLPSGHTINRFKPLFNRIEEEAIETMMSDAKPEDAAPKAAPAEAPKKEDDFIKIDDFAKVDLRVAKIVDAQPVEGADKLIQLTVNLGEELGNRNIFAGIKSAYDPSTLIGRLTVVVANLAPRKMRFGVSEGMVIAASDPEKDGIFILSPDSGAEPGMRIS